MVSSSQPGQMPICKKGGQEEGVPHAHCVSQRCSHNMLFLLPTTGSQARLLVAIFALSDSRVLVLDSCCLLCESQQPVQPCSHATAVPRPVVL